MWDSGPISNMMNYSLSFNKIPIGVMDQTFVSSQTLMLKSYPQCDAIRRWGLRSVFGS